MAERISFTRPSAERIARAVRAVENTRLDGQALSFRRQMLEGVRSPIKLAIFQGPWPRDSVNTIMFKGTDRTAEAANLFFPVPGTQTRECAVAKIGTAWFLIDVKLAERTAVFVTSTAATSLLTDVTLSASLNTSACTISIGKTLVTASTILVTGTVTGTYLTVEA